MLLLSGKEIRYFPSILYGQILAGPGMSKYETVFTVSAKKETRATLQLFADKGERMEATFVDELGKAAGTGHSFELFLAPGRPVRIRLALMPDQAGSEVAVMTGWATFESTENIDVVAVVRITTPDGKLINRHVLAPEEPALSLREREPEGRVRAGMETLSARPSPGAPRPPSPGGRG